MPSPLIEIGWWGLAFLAAIPVLTLVCSLAWRLAAAWDLSVATLRSLAQLVAIGFVIEWVFRQSDWYWIGALLTVMTVVAGFTGGRRVRRHLPRFGPALTLLLAGVTAGTLAYVAAVVLRLDHWEARYLVPLGGIMLGNGMTAATLAVERLADALRREATDVEVWLALGASPAQAVRPLRQAAVRAALTPFINTMLIVGIVQLPGIFSGTLLGGGSPFQAALYQFLILVALAWIALAAAIGSTAAVIRRCFTPAWQLDRDALPPTAG